MAQQQISGLAALSCYTVDSDSEEEEGGGEDRIQDFGDLVIKQEVAEVKDEEDQSMAWQVDTQGHVDPVDEARVNSDFLNPQDIKVEIESEDESSSSSSDSDSSSDSEEDEKSTNQVKANKDKEPGEGDEYSGPPKTANEKLTKDLPPVDDVTAIVPAAECQVIGHIKNLVEDLVVVESLIGIPALDLDSVLFVREGSLALGRVFDVIGPVTQPLYVVRFNSKQHIAERGVTVGMKVYFAPRSELTSYVFLEQLMAMKISDASWVNDEEPPPQFLDYSDDEEEQRVKREHKAKKKVEQQQLGDNGEATEAKRPRENSARPSNKNLRQCNNRYTPDSNPFYRTSRAYNPSQSGGIQWSQYSVPGQYSQYTQPPPGPFSGPPPPPGQYQAPPPGPQYYPQYSQAQAAGAWQSHYNSYSSQAAPSPYHQLTSSIAQTQHQQSSLVASLSSPPPPPPPGE